MKTINEIIEAARTENLTGKKIKALIAAAGLPVETYSEIRTALGRDVGPATESKAAAPAIEAVPARKATGNMTLKFDGEDYLTGEPLAAGTSVTGVKVGGRWTFTAEPVEAVELRKLVEAVLLSIDPDQGGPDCEIDLDHEDIDLLVAFGDRYENMRWKIGYLPAGVANW